jgi:hypothetical protein
MPRGLILLLMASVLVATAAYSSLASISWVYYVGHRVGAGTAEFVNLALAIVWLGMFVAAVVAYGYRGTSLLIGAGLALWWPLLFFMMWIAGDGP